MITVHNLEDTKFTFREFYLPYFIIILLFVYLFILFFSFFSLFFPFSLWHFCLLVLRLSCPQSHFPFLPPSPPYIQFSFPFFCFFWFLPWKRLCFFFFLFFLFLSNSESRDFLDSAIWITGSKIHIIYRLFFFYVCFIHLTLLLAIAKHDTRRDGSNDWTPILVHGK